MADNSLDLHLLLTSWLRTLRGERSSPSTVKAYGLGVRTSLAFCATAGLPAQLTKVNVLALHGQSVRAEPATARLRLAALKLFAQWLAAEEGFDADRRARPCAHPGSTSRPCPRCPTTRSRRLVKACDGPALRDKRDKAAVVLFTETGLRASELLALDIVRYQPGRLHPARAPRQGWQGPPGPVLRVRRRRAGPLHQGQTGQRAPSDAGPLWVGAPRSCCPTPGWPMLSKAAPSSPGSKASTSTGCGTARPCAGSASGGSETGLMAQSGWRSRQMIDRYIQVGVRGSWPPPSSTGSAWRSPSCDRLGTCRGIARANRGPVCALSPPRRQVLRRRRVGPPRQMFMRPAARTAAR